MGNLLAMKHVFHQLSVIINKKQKRQAVGVIIVIIIGSAFELLGVTAILPFIQILLTPEKIMHTKWLKPFIDVFHVTDSMQMMLLIGTGLIVLYIVKNVYLTIAYYIRCSYSASIQKTLSIRMLYAYMERPYIKFINLNSGEIIRGCSGDIDGVHAILLHLLTVVAELLTIVLIGIYLLFVDPVMALGAMTLMILVMIFIVIFFKPAMKQLGKKNMKANAQRNKALLQTVQGAKELFVMQRKELFLDSYSRAAEEVRKTNRNSEFINICPERIIEGICISGLIGIVMYRLVTGGDVNAFVPKLAAFAMAAFKILPSVSKISSRLTGIMYFRPMLDNVYNNIMVAKEYEEEKVKLEKNVQDNLAIPEFKDKLILSHIDWTYSSHTAPILKDISLEINKGESVALIGASGAGKTTLSDIILGLLRPQSGSIYMDGVDIFTIPKQWAKVIGYVPQSVFLIDDTIRNNVAFGLKKAGEEEIWNALEKAQLKQFVERLPEGLDTVVGERGVKLSGGQRQRIAIARALYNMPQILILDEATASLDNETENAVMEAIDALQGEITMVIVAHRLTTIRNCDKIYEIVEGRAVIKCKEEIFE